MRSTSSSSYGRPISSPQPHPPLDLHLRTTPSIRCHVDGMDARTLHASKYFNRCPFPFLICDQPKRKFAERRRWTAPSTDSDTLPRARRDARSAPEIRPRLSGTSSVFVCVTFLNSLYDSMFDAHAGALYLDSVFGSRDGYFSGSLVWKTIVSSPLTLYPYLSSLLLEPPLSRVPTDARCAAIASRSSTP